MFKRVFVAIVLLISLSKPTLAFGEALLQSNVFMRELEQHGTFTAADLLTSPWLRVMFKLSVDEVDGNLLRICINQQATCRLVPKEATVSVVAAGDDVQFVDQLDSIN